MAKMIEFADTTARTQIAAAIESGQNVEVNARTGGSPGRTLYGFIRKTETGNFDTLYHTLSGTHGLEGEPIKNKEVSPANLTETIDMWFSLATQYSDWAASIGIKTKNHYFIRIK